MVKGAKSFQDMATVNGMVYVSFRDACKARGMMDDDSEIIAALQEIVDTTISVEVIRRQFVILLLNGAPANAQALFHFFADDLCDARDGPDAVNIALHALEAEMQERHRSLQDADYGFIMPEVGDLQRVNRRRCLADVAIATAEAVRLRDSITSQFTDEQHAALHRIIRSIDEDHDIKLFGLLASAGCGKTIFAC